MFFKFESLVTACEKSEARLKVFSGKGEDIQDPMVE
jgi:hypothetical protein